ncbi:hypothetical protein XarbCFBP7604_08350 [Xanthomonas arboricola]|nr:hypothetical protein XarbCFBP7604_08350 [Xanthomonas arboricola]
MGNGEWGMGNGEWGMGNGEWGIGRGPSPCRSSLMMCDLLSDTVGTSQQGPSPRACCKKPSAFAIPHSRLPIPDSAPHQT